jgi:hypothetical protein
VAMAFQTPAAKAVLFDWSYAGFNGGPVAALGTLQATPDGGGVYTVTSIAGTRNGVPITGLTVYAGLDNLVYTDAANLYGVDAHVDYPGLAYTDLSGAAFNVFYDISASDPYNCGRIGYCEIGPGIVGTSGLGPPRDSVGPIEFFTLTGVPEPATWTMLLIGFAGIGFAAYRRTRRDTSIAAA